MKACTHVPQLPISRSIWILGILNKIRALETSLYENNLSWVSFENLINIFKAKRGEYDVTGLGEKFIAVDMGGTLVLHGEDRLSWTKLTKTLHKLSPENGILFHHKVHEFSFIISLIDSYMHS